MKKRTLTPRARQGGPPFPSFASEVISPRATSTRDLPALETLMQSLVLDAQSCVALEVVGQDHLRRFVLRGNSQPSLDHLESQIRALYPQAEIIPLPSDEDPWRLGSDEAITALELEAGAPPYLSIKTWRTRDFEHEGTDPLLGILSALSRLPPGTRVICQLTLTPAEVNWSARYARLAVEHPLEPERKSERVQARASSGRSSSAPGMPQIIGAALVLALLLLWQQFSREITAAVPWLGHDISLLLSGRIPTLSPSEIAQVAAALMALLAAALLVRWVLPSRKTLLYDMRQVEEKIRRMAYRTRLRLIVIGPEEARRRAHRGQACLVVFLEGLDWLRGRSSWTGLRELIRDEGRRVARGVRYERAQAALRTTALDQVVAAYRQYHQASGGYFRPLRLSSKRTQRLLGARQAGMERLLRSLRHTWWGGWLVALPALISPLVVLVRSLWWRGWQFDVYRSEHLLSVAEVAGLWHLPQGHDLPDLAYVRRGRARTLPAPAVLTQGLGTRIGTNEHAGYQTPVFLPQAALTGNIGAFASTGKGKSTLFTHLGTTRFTQASTAPGQGPAARNSLLFLEPHGDTIAHLCRLLPAQMVEEVVLIDLAREERIPGINPLDMQLGRDRDKISDDLISIFSSIWDKSWGTRTESIMTMSIKTLCDANTALVARGASDAQYTLLDIVSLLRNHDFRQIVLADVGDETLQKWWPQNYESLDPYQQSDATLSVINKMSKFASSKTSRRILGQPTSSLNMSEIIGAGRHVLISTAGSSVGDDTSSLIGATLLGLFQTALSEQGTLPEASRTRYLLLIDEFQVYRGARYVSMLGELRKFGGTFGLATQSLAYLDELDATLRPTVLSNIDHIYAFDMSAQDAYLMTHELDGVEVADIINLDNFQCYAKLSLAGQRLPTFSLRLERPAEGQPAIAAAIVDRSARYSRPVDEVDVILSHLEARRKLAPDPPKGKKGNKPGPAAQPNAWQNAPSGQGQPSPDTKEPHNRRGTYGAKGPRKHEPPQTGHDGKTPLSRPLAQHDEAWGNTPGEETHG